MATSDGVPQRDLILGFTRASSIGAPGMVLMSKFAPPGTTFTQADMAGPWRVYMERVESKLAGSTWEIGLSNFSAGGAFTGGTLTDEVGTATVLTTGGLVVAAALQVPNVMPATVVLRADGSVAEILPRSFATADEIAEAVNSKIGVG